MLSTTLLLAASMVVGQAGKPSAYKHLKDLEWLIGKSVGEYELPDGRRKKEKAGVTKQDAKELLIRRKSEILKGEFLDPKSRDLTFAEYASRFLEDYGDTKLSKYYRQTLTETHAIMRFFGKMQLGSGWWFLDQRDGMQAQMRALSNLGLLSRFVGMVTDSRSLLSYSRHELFRRILCNLLGEDVRRGLIPDEREILGRMVRDISFANARDFFGFKLGAAANGYRA